MVHTDQVVKFEAENLLSQVLEHEVDHLNGILYSDHLAEHLELYTATQEEEGLAEEDVKSAESPASLKID